MNIILYITIVFLIMFFISSILINIYNPVSRKPITTQSPQSTQSTNEHFANINKVHVIKNIILKIELKLDINLDISDLSSDNILVLKNKIKAFLLNDTLFINDNIDKNKILVNRVVNNDKVTKDGIIVYQYLKNINKKQLINNISKINFKTEPIYIIFNDINGIIQDITYDITYDNQLMSFIPNNSSKFNFNKDIKILPINKIENSNLDLDLNKLYNLKNIKNNSDYIKTLIYKNKTQPPYSPFKSYIYNDTNEISINDLTIILNNLIEMYPCNAIFKSDECDNLNEKFVVKQNYNNVILLNILDWITEIISQNAKINTKFIYKNYYVIEYSSYNKLYKYEVIFKIYREDKLTNFNIYMKIIIDIANMNYYIEDIFIVGLDTIENIIFGDLKQSELYKFNEDCIHDSMIDNTNNINAKSNYSKEKEEFIKDKMLNKDIFRNSNPHKCFFKNADSKKNCVNDDKNGEGIWDSPCVTNEDCHFYKSNINYDNEYGKCINGYCEMPLNVNLYGYKKFTTDDMNMVLCHNCHTESNCKGLDCHRCCEEQKDRDKYPKLKGPDYAFKNDIYERLKYNDDFLNKNLSAYTLYNI